MKELLVKQRSPDPPSIQPSETTGMGKVNCWKLAGKTAGIKLIVKDEIYFVAEGDRV